MASAQGLTLLRQVPFFNNLSVEGLDAVYGAALSRAYPDNSFLFHQDDPADRVFVLTEGRVKLFQLTLDGQQVIMRVVTPGMMMGAIGMIAGAVFPVSAQAAEDSRALYWPQEEILALVDRYPVLALNALRLLSDHVREFQDRYRELATERVERRVARMILRLASQTGRKTEQGVLLDIPLTRQDIAEMSGTTLYTVSRILSQWEGQGLVLVGREKVVIRFPHGLVRIAEDLPLPPDIKIKE
jgi:CRP/FNR family transcriptional regulator, nitrogen oxide reductase regulator